MTQVTVFEAQNRLPQLLDAAKQGEGVEIVHADGWTFSLAAKPPAKHDDRPATGFGSCRGMIWMAPDFDAPLDEFREYME